MLYTGSLAMFYSTLIGTRQRPTKGSAAHTFEKSRV